MNLDRKLAVLADAAKYDASCASSGTSQRDSVGGRGIGSTEGAGICHSYAPDGRCISLLKILLTNYCLFDCLYCVNRVSSNVPRARFSVQEVVDLTLDFYRRNCIEGLFLSSGIIRSPDYTMERVVEVARVLREEHDFRGYIHLKTIPDASPELLAAAGRYADRLSINIELPSVESLAELAPEKDGQAIRRSMARLRVHIDEAKAERPAVIPIASQPGLRPRRAKAPAFAPAGQSTQMIVGADATDDRRILETSATLYAGYQLRRVYYSAFSPIPDAAQALPLKAPPLVREHRLYQADWLMRFYGFAHDEIVPPGQGMLALEVDPKLGWALANRAHFPVDLNRAPKEMLLRVPGLGVKAVERLLQARRHRQVQVADLTRLHVPLKKVLPFVELPGHHPGAQLDALDLQRAVAPRLQSQPAQRSLFDAPEEPTPPVSRRATMMQTPLFWRDESGAGTAASTSPPVVPLLHTVHLAGPTDLAGFRRQARRLVAQQVAPEQVVWQVRLDDADERDLFGSAPVDDAMDTAPASGTPALQVPAFFLPLCEQALLHSAPHRFALLYRLLWRLQHEPGLRHDPLDPDRLQAEAWARAVRRDMHKMTAFVRFRPLAGEAASADAAEGWHVAWFEPEHHIVEATAPFFTRRFAQMRWAILSPRCSARWDGQSLHLGPGARREDAPAPDAGETLWLTYYAHIFNPARLKLKMMQKEMPRRYWHNLPEATLIQPLVAAAATRSGRMVDQGASTPAHRRPASSEALRVASTPTLHEAPATQPVDWDTLGRDLARCRACPIGACATQVVPGEGPRTAALMLVGEQPGDQEDLQGRPFVGPAGQLLDEAFRHLGWQRDELYLTNAVKHFKFELRGKRRLHKTAALREAEACAHWLESEIALLRPRAAIALGATATRALLGPGVKVTASRGQWFNRADGLRVLVTLHPSALLRSEADAREITRTAAFAEWLRDLRQAQPVPVDAG